MKVDLLSLVFILQPPSFDRPWPAWWARAGHALVMRLVQQADAGLAQRIHDDPAAPRPFTVSTLWGGDLAAGEPVCWRVTALNGPMAGLLLAAAAEGGAWTPGSTLELDGHAFRILQVFRQPSGHPWAQTHSWQALARPWLHAPAARPPRRLSLSLAAPVTFKKDGRHLPFPLPELVFGSLLTRWNAFAPVALPEDLRRYVAECLVVTGYRLRTRSVPLKGGGRRIGSVGWVTFRSLCYDRYWLSLLHALTDLAFFSGLGAGVTMGLGQARRRE